MNNLTLNLNKDSLLDLMKDFNLLTGLKIALFDTNGNEILSYPEAHCKFCTAIRSTQTGNEACLYSNKKSFEKCQTTQKLEIFTCHAGLVEATAPMIDNGTIVGYIMFGQITDKKDKTIVKDMLYDALAHHKNNDTGVNLDIFSVEYKSKEQILAAAKILEACTFYVLLKDMVSLQRETFIENLNKYLLAHLSEDLSVNRLTEEFNISKNKLYDSCSKYLNTGIAEHIKMLRIAEAKRLLKETDLLIIEISEQVGFTDYNYFCRVFKNIVGMPSKKYRSTHSINT